MTCDTYFGTCYILHHYFLSKETSIQQTELA